MRLTCPSCGAIYVVKDDAVPSGGSHVQCSACHTRWFARPASPAPERLSEEQIIARLETRWSQPASAEDDRPASDDGSRTDAPATRREPPPPPIAFPATRRADLRLETDAPGPEPVASAPTASASAGPAPAASAPAALAPVDAPDVAAAPATPLRPRAASTRKPPTAPPPTRRGGVAAVAGFLLPVALAALGIGVYLRAADLSAAAPSAGPALAVYVAQIDAGRDWVEARIGPLRAGSDGPGG